MRTKTLVRVIIGAGGFVLEDVAVNTKMNEINLAKLIIRTAFDFRNVDNLAAMVMLSCSDLRPALPGI